jgi:hypothetical protein
MDGRKGPLELLTLQAWRIEDASQQELRASIQPGHGAGDQAARDLPNYPFLANLHADRSLLPIETYFRYFHHTHQILLARKKFEERLSKGLIPHHLECAVKFNSSTSHISEPFTNTCKGQNQKAVTVKPRYKDVLRGQQN